MRCRSVVAVVAVVAFAPLSLLAQTKPLLTTADYGQWQTPGTPKLAPRGDWVAIPIARVNEQNELQIRGITRDTTITVPFATAATFATATPWMSYLVGVSPAERDKLTKDKKPVRTSVELRNLSTHVIIRVADVASVIFSADGRAAALTRYPAEGKKVAEVLIYDLDEQSRIAVAGVSESAWSDVGSALALMVEGEGDAGHSVQVFDARTKTIKVLQHGGSPFRAVTWRKRSSDLAVLQSRPDSAFRDTAYVLHVFSAVSATCACAPVTLDPAKVASFPIGVRIAEHRRATWSRDGSVVFFGTQKREPVATAIKKSAERVSDVEIWHTNDVRMFAQQKAQEAQDLKRTVLTAWRVSESRVVPLATDVTEDAQVLEGGRYAIESDAKPYPWENKFGRDVEDVWVTDVATGTRTRVLTRVRHMLGGDPTGTRLAWSDGKDYWIVDLGTGTRTNLTASLTRAGADFVDHDDDHPTDIPHIFPIAGWAKGGTALLVNDTHDVWRLALDGSGGTRLTNGAKEDVRHRLVNFAPQSATAAERAADLAAPQYFTLFGRHNKQGGYARRTARGVVERVVLADAGYRALTRADSANTYAFIRNRYDESPDVYVGSDIGTARKLTATNPFQSHYAWGKVELVNFTSSIGVPLQALLYYPANYDASKKYPLIVYTYERLTDGLHNYVAPNQTNYYNTTVYTSHGYFVLMPDIIFRPREPGIAAQQSVESAVRSVIARGFIDSTRVGHVGHSQGGYEAAFLGTHSTVFATTVVGSGITDMVSFAGQLHWNGGTAEFDHWETGQFRMQVAPWEDEKAMHDNSPLAAVQNMPAKSMLLEIGSDDGTVDPRQGSLFYNYARRAGKHVVLLTYPGEGHGLQKKENQADYQSRILQWFAYYLKGEPAAPWILNGQTALERRAVLEANK